jgi:hypothetical protein
VLRTYPVSEPARPTSPNIWRTSTDIGPVRRRIISAEPARAFPNGQGIDVLVSARRDADAARRFFRRALSALKVTPTEVVTDAAAIYPGVLDELIPAGGIMSSSTRTIRSRPIIANSNTG